MISSANQGELCHNVIRQHSPTGRAGQCSVYWAKAGFHQDSGARLFLEQSPWLSSMGYLLLLSLVLMPALGCTPWDQHLRSLPNIPQLPKT